MLRYHRLWPSLRHLSAFAFVSHRNGDPPSPACAGARDPRRHAKGRGDRRCGRPQVAERPAARRAAEA
eukprot:6606970-Prymnesium_polylepis.1